MRSAERNPSQYKFNPGDTVYTSGYSSIFPSDIPNRSDWLFENHQWRNEREKVKKFQDLKPSDT
jgi:hypothetical protein